MLSSILQIAEGVVSILWCPAILCHEYSHYITARLLGYDSTIEWNLGSFDVKSRVQIPFSERLEISASEQVLVTIFAPFTLILPAMISLRIGEAMITAQPRWLTAFGVGLCVQSLGFFLQAGPSRSDIESVFYTAGWDPPLLTRCLDYLCLGISVGLSYVSFIWIFVGDPF
jgi:hypothetical protein